ncbi:long-chain-fatty-acid--CoA ligase [Govanella unica]|uniref:3-methylmercaptopropionyl-CoA ligase n=1 Tax=Govanella unica TaxID=2975056 RepID=A0A9X3TVN5_9PROT|nr:long-chain-fatty-acid--CoA ligase [Govania unica]MDA5192533.1 long-chain-fatty-acid--CoA ligase [Govania unica]
MTLLGLMQDRPLLIADLLHYAATYHGDREIVSRSVEGPITRQGYAEAEQRAKKLVKTLLRFGIKDSDRIATLAWSTARHFELFYAVSGMGAVLNTVNPRLFDEQIAYIINHAENRVLFFETSFLEIVERLAPRLPMVERYVVMTDRAHMPSSSSLELACYEDLLAAEDADYDWPLFDERKAASLCYTSGTTGHPKGVLYSHRSTVIHAMAAAQNGAFGISPSDAIMPIAPMYHANSWGLPYIAPMCGAKLVLPGPGMDAQSIQELIESEGVSFTCAVPTVFTTLFQYLEQTGKRIDSLKRAMIGGSAVPRAMADKLFHSYGVKVLQLWGMTELSPLGTIATPTPRVEELPAPLREDILSKQGRVQFGLEIKVLDADGHEVPRDGVTSGELWVRGPWVASGYFRHDQPVLDADGWFPTGDVVAIDEFGYIRITDRAKDVIKSGGEWISSIDLENLAVGHPAVKMAAVVGVFHPKWEERPLMVVVPKDGATVTEREILDYLSDKVAKWWLPDAVVITDDMPLTATGKYRKTELRDRYRDYLTTHKASAGA